MWFQVCHASSRDSGCSGTAPAYPCTRGRGPWNIGYRSRFADTRVRSGWNGTGVGYRLPRARHTITFPAILDRRVLARDIGFGENRVFEASHHGQATGRFEARIEAHRTACVLVKGRGECRTTEG